MSQYRTIALTSAFALLVVGLISWRLQPRPSAPVARADGLGALIEGASACPEPSARAAHAATAARQEAQARMQRYAFAPHEGRLALNRLSVAVECARLAGDAGLLTSATHEQAALQAQLERDARDHLRRYEILKRRGRLAEASADIAFLIELGWPEAGELAAALRRDRDALRGGS